MDQDLLAKIALVRRQTRSQDIMDICDALEKSLLVRPLPVTAPEQVRPRFDKNAYQKRYMKTYMAKRRAEARRPKVNPTDRP